MTLLRRVPVCVLFFGAICALDLIAQDSTHTKLQSNPASVPSAVVQLLAVGPGARGRNQDCSATGFIINEDGYILTNAHVVEKSKECLAQSPGAKLVAKFANSVVVEHPLSGNLDASRPAETTAPAVACDVVGVDDVHDFAVLKPERRPPIGGAGHAIPYVLLGATQASIGTAVKVTGHPVFAWVALTQSGRIIAHRSLPLFERSDAPSEMIALDIPLKHGSSGSPVYLEVGGAVVGVVERQNSLDPSQTLAVPIRYAIELLDRLGVKWHAKLN
jgi:S1-C subfamily serine protease